MPTTSSVYCHPRAFDSLSCSRKRAASGGFSLVELLTAVAIVSILSALTFSGYPRIRAKLDESMCASNLRQLYVCMGLYVNEKGAYPSAYSSSEWGSIAWNGYLQKAYVLDKYDKIVSCPAAIRVETATTSPKLTYAMNSQVQSATPAEIIFPSKTALLGDGPNNPVVWWQGTFGRPHGNLPLSERAQMSLPTFRANVLFCDGHVESRAQSEIPDWNQPQGTDDWYFWRGQ